ncbi:hypothetical protein HPB47_003333 [Ixodes persulcatus]|uniref:Uncharacterized protein n=1 Tax=Ixodes persulcatus TaxID=34615 RepID=A0AC60PIT4_IXOPE|nr:hypothetical protein HPB47_003333 [Ixodes persulcatus]
MALYLREEVSQDAAAPDANRWQCRISAASHEASCACLRRPVATSNGVAAARWDLHSETHIPWLHYASAVGIDDGERQRGERQSAPSVYTRLAS